MMLPLTQTSLAEELRRAVNRPPSEIEGGFPEAMGMDVTPVWNQLAFRWRKDDGNETTATWWAANNVNATSGDLTLDTNVRIRFEIEETATASPALGLTAQLQYQLNGSGTWVAVNASSSVVRSAASGNLADGAATTNLVDTSARAFQAGVFDEVDGSTGSIAGLSNESTNVEYCVQIRSADVVGGDSIQLRVANATVALNTYTQTPVYDIPLSDPGGSLPITDTFTDTDAVLLQSHFPDSSVGSDSIWHPLGFAFEGSSSTTNASMLSNRLQRGGTTSGSRGYRNTAVPSSAEYDVEASFTRGANPVTGVAQVVLLGRVSATGTGASSVDRYQGRISWSSDGTGSTLVEKSVSGTITALDTVSGNPGAGTYALKFEIRDAGKTFYRDAVSIATTSDNAITQVGRAGLIAPPTNSGANYLDNFSATNVGGAASVTPTTLALVTASFAPVLHLVVTPTTLALTTATFAPSVTTGTLVTPTTLALTTATFAPVLNEVTTPGTASLALTSFAPVLKEVLTPPTVALTTATFAPVLKETVTPANVALTLATFEPTVSFTAHVTVTPDVLALITAAFAPTVTVGVTVTPTTLALATTAFAPTIVTPQTVTPTTAALTIASFAPVLQETTTPTTATLTLTAFEPTVTAGAGGGGTTVTPDLVALTLTSFAPQLQEVVTPYPVAATATVYAITDYGERDNTSTTYATARAGGGTHSGSTSDILAGQRKSGANYTVYQGFLAFDVSGLPAGPVLGATLSLYDLGSFANHVLEIRAKDWRPTLDSADFVAGDDLSALTLLATCDQDARSGGAATAEELFAFTEEGTNLREAIEDARDGSGFLEVVIVSSRVVAGTVPTGNEYSILGVSSAGAFPGFEPEIQVTVASGLRLTSFAPSIVSGTVVTPTTASLTLATFAPTLVSGTVVTPTTASLTLTAFAPVLHEVVTPTTAALTLNTFAPSFGASITPTTAALTLAMFAPVLQETTTPTIASFTLTTFAPSITSGMVVTPTTAALTTSTFAPVLSETVTPSPAALALSSFAPVLANTTPVPVVGLTLTTFAPVLDTGVIIAAASLALTTFEPTILFPTVITPDTTSLILTTFEPTIDVILPKIARARGMFRAVYEATGRDRLVAGSVAESAALYVAVGDTRTLYEAVGRDRALFHAIGRDSLGG